MAFNFQNFDFDAYEDKLNWVRKYQRYVYLFLVLLIAIPLFFSIVVPAYQNLEKQKGSLERFKLSLERNKSKVLDKDHLDSELTRLRSELIALENHMFIESEVNEFSINTIFHLVEGFDGKVSRVNFSKPKLVKDQDLTMPTRLYAYPMNVKLDMDFVGMMNVFNVLENYSRLLHIEKFSLFRRSENPVRLSADLSLNLFMIQDATEAEIEAAKKAKEEAEKKAKQKARRRGRNAR